jgi:hypothetical protein
MWRRIERVGFFALLFLSCWVAGYALLHGWGMGFDALFSSRSVMLEEYEKTIGAVLPPGTSEPEVEAWLVAQNIPYKRKRDPEGRRIVHGTVDLTRRWLSCPTGYIWLDFYFDEQDHLRKHDIRSWLYTW